MNSKSLYINMFQLLADHDTIRERPSQTDFSRQCFVTKAWNAGPESDMLSLAVLEFEGQRTKFVTLITFDGSGSYGASLNSFSMPRQKLTLLTKALLMMSVMQYLIDNGELKAEFEFYIDKISHDFDGGVTDLRKKYESLCARSQKYIEAIEGCQYTVATGALALVQ
jgi:hypothetical protein